MLSLPTTLGHFSSIKFFRFALTIRWRATHTLPWNRPSTTIKALLKLFQICSETPALISSFYNDFSITEVISYLLLDLNPEIVLLRRIQHYCNYFRFALRSRPWNRPSTTIKALLKLFQICSDDKKTCCTTPALKSSFADDWSKNDLETWTKKHFGPCK